MNPRDAYLEYFNFTKSTKNQNSSDLRKAAYIALSDSVKQGYIDSVISYVLELTNKRNYLKLDKNEDQAIDIIILAINQHIKNDGGLFKIASFLSSAIKNEVFEKTDEVNKIMLHLAEKLHVPNACFYLSQCASLQKQKKLELLQKSARGGFHPAQFEIAIQHYDDQERLAQLKKIAKKGYNPAQLEVGKHYFKIGKYKTSEYWLTMASEDGLLEAQYYLIRLNLKKPENEQSIIRLSNWLIMLIYDQKISDQLKSSCLIELARIFERFPKVKDFLAKYDAYKKYNSEEACYKGAHDLGNIYASFQLGLVKFKEEKHQEAADYFLVAAEKGLAIAQYWLGETISSAATVAIKNKDFSEAKLCYQKAAEGNIADAQFRLGELHEKEEKYEDAIKYYMASVDNGSSKGLLQLAQLEEKGLGIAKNIERSRYHYKELICSNGDARAVDCYKKLSPADKANQEKCTKNLMQAITDGDFYNSTQAHIDGAQVDISNIRLTNAITHAYFTWLHEDDGDDSKNFKILHTLLLNRGSLNLSDLEHILSIAESKYKKGDEYSRENFELICSMVNNIVGISVPIDGRIFKVDIKKLFNDPENIERYRTHLISLDLSIVTKNARTRLTGWNNIEAMATRVAIFFEIALKLKLDIIREHDFNSKINKVQVLKKLLPEICILVEACRNMCYTRMITNNAKCNDNDKMKLLSAISFNIADKICLLDQGQEYVIATGYRGHALYVSFNRTSDDIIQVRIDNLGGGSLGKHQHKTEQKSGKVTQCNKPYLIGQLPISDFYRESEPCDKIVSYIKDILRAKQLEKEEALSLIYKKLSVEEQTSLDSWPFIECQVVANCSVRNLQPGLRIRMDIGENYNTKNGVPLLYTFLRKQEEIVITQLRSLLHAEDYDEMEDMGGIAQVMGDVYVSKGLVEESYHSHQLPIAQLGMFRRDTKTQTQGEAVESSFKTGYQYELSQLKK